MAKEIKMTVNSCLGCPFARENYGEHHFEPAYICDKTEKGLVDSEDLDEYYDKADYYERMRGTLFPVPEPEHPLDTMPEWCPLPDVGESK